MSFLQKFGRKWEPMRLKPLLPLQFLRMCDQLVAGKPQQSVNIVREYEILQHVTPTRHSHTNRCVPRVFCELDHRWRREWPALLLPVVE